MGLFNNKNKYKKIESVSTQVSDTSSIRPLAQNNTPSPITPGLLDLSKAVQNVMPQVMESVIQQQAQSIDENKYIEKSKIVLKIKQLKEEIQTTQIMVHVYESLI